MAAAATTAKFGGRTIICVLRNDLRYHDNEVGLTDHIDRSGGVEGIASGQYLKCFDAFLSIIMWETWKFSSNLGEIVTLIFWGRYGRERDRIDSSFLCFVILRKWRDIICNGIYCNLFLFRLISVFCKCMSFPIFHAFNITEDLLIFIVYFYLKNQDLAVGPQQCWPCLAYLLLRPTPLQRDLALWLPEDWTFQVEVSTREFARPKVNSAKGWKVC